MSVVVREASAADFSAIHALNHETFALEIPQHGARGDGLLVDRFHAQNRYLVAGDRAGGGELLGMLALRDRRPFSLDGKVENLDSFLPSHRRAVEVRLLAVRSDSRNGPVLASLLAAAWEESVARGWDMALISGIVARVRLYESLGFVAFGPRVGHDAAVFQPMYVTGDAFLAGVGGDLARRRGRVGTV